jgi:hypothetical protein
VLWRLAFTQELWHALGHDDVDLYRAATTERDAIRGTPAVTFVSATFSRQVADAHFQGGPATRVAVMWRQRVAIERAVMTFIETEEMNERFHEAEAVLLADPSSPAF